jgi:hypothetical protein
MLLPLCQVVEAAQRAGWGLELRHSAAAVLAR